MKARQTRNKVARISTEAWDLLTEPTQIQQEFLLFFKNLLGIQAAEMASLDINIAGDGPCLTQDQQMKLMKEITREDVLLALKKLPLDKAPGIDGFLAEFFKTSWGQ